MASYTGFGSRPSIYSGTRCLTEHCWCQSGLHHRSDFRSAIDVVTSTSGRHNRTGMHGEPAMISTGGWLELCEPNAKRRAAAKCRVPLEHPWRECPAARWLTEGSSGVPPAGRPVHTRSDLWARRSRKFRIPMRAREMTPAAAKVCWLRNHLVDSHHSQRK